MILLPAIDLYGGKVVRLTEGDFGRKANYEINALDAAKNFLNAGCKYIHIVDLEGAKVGKPCHLPILEEISKLGMFVQYGGGLRTQQAVKDAITAGANRVMIGSLLFKNPEMPKLLSEEFKEMAMPAIDIKSGKVVHSGWLEATGKSPLQALTELNEVGFTCFLVTDTERDGKMSGIRSELYKPLINDKYEIIAAGGITTTDDIKTLSQIGIKGTVIGKSLYEGGITLEQALKVAYSEA
ncbi:MAG: 1-(5-phosphoribosyl)-5-[(5-phosphoribosylamino)methylideneamino] imidazole-4-carboxamide isomerase [Synergistaceae bacterium]